MQIVRDWLDGLIESHGIMDETELTPTMLKSEIEESEGAIRNEQIWSNGAGNLFAALYHDQNITAHRLYIRYLRTLMKNNGHLSEHSLCIGIYTDPDELPFQVVFLLPESTTAGELRTKLAMARDTVRQEDYPDIEDHFEAVLNEAAAAFDFGYWYYDELISLRGKENLWEIKMEGDKNG